MKYMPVSKGQWQATALCFVTKSGDFLPQIICGGKMKLCHREKPVTLKIPVKRGDCATLPIHVRQYSNSIPQLIAYLDKTTHIW